MSNMRAYDDSEDPAPPPQNGCFKVFLVLLIVAAVGSFVLCGGAGLIFWWVTTQFNMSMDPVKVREAANSIVDISLPDSYKPNFTGEVKAVKVKMAVFGNEEKQIALMLLSVPQEIVEKSSEKDEAVEKAGEASGGKIIKTEKTEKKTFKVRGQDVDFVFIEGSDDKGQKRKQISGEFPGKNDQKAILMLFGSPDKLSEQDLQGLLETIK